MKRCLAGLAALAASMVLVGIYVMSTRGDDTTANETRVPIVFTGGHKTDPRDGGRPVVLVAAGLEVSPEVFRKAFKGVTPARGGPQTREQVHRNKEALLRVLAPHGVTNDRLDEVSDYYRYRPQRGELWRTTPAKAYAVIEGGKIKKIVVTNGGAGYSSPPKATPKGMEGTRLVVELQFDKDLRKNGSIRSIKLASPKGSASERPDR